MAIDQGSVGRFVHGHLLSVSALISAIIIGDGRPRWSSKLERRAMRGTLLIRGLTRRCPRCGEWRIFSGYFALKDECPRCGLDLVREQGYYVGAMTVNIIAAELLAILIIVAVTIGTWPDLPVNALIIAGVGVNLLFPALFYPLTKTLWLGIDLGFLNQIDPDEMR
jgi:uncharacterized protein (DUF983 family)